MQRFEMINQQIREGFLLRKKEKPELFENRIKFSWSNWGFGREPFEKSVKRLSDRGIRFIELHGNHYGADLGYKAAEVKRILSDYGVQAAGICGMFSSENDLASPNGGQRQNALDYIKRELAFGKEVGAEYMLVVPGAVGRPVAYDSAEFDRSVETLRIVADLFTKHGIKAAIEPIRAAEVSFIHTFDEAKQYIAAVDHPGVRHINGDLYHMLVSESHMAQAIVDAGEMLVNLHLADTNRGALGSGMLDVDTLIMALYLIGYNNRKCYVTPEPLGPGGDPYPAMNGYPEADMLDRLVSDTVTCWREREEAVLSL